MAQAVSLLLLLLLLLLSLNSKLWVWQLSVHCIQYEALVYPESSDPGISKRNADRKLEAFKHDFHHELKSGQRPKNVILFIGDGMGISTLTGARYTKAQNLGLAAGEVQLAWDDWPSVALVTTHSADRMTTDSGTSATAIMCGLFSGSHMDYEIQRRDQPSLAEMTSVAIQILSRNFKGFLLLVEGGRIDHAHHTNMAKAALTDTLAMENAVLTAVRETDPKETLILVTADHSHGYGIAGYATRRQNIFDIDDTQEADDGMPYLISSYFNGPAAKINQTRENPLKPGRLDDLAMQQALVPLSLATHTGEDVALYSTGPMHQLFHGTIDNTFIAYGTMYALCLEPYKNASHCQQSKGTRNAKQQTISIVLQLSTLFWLQMN
ncbi:unnamed protein product [Dicrocoelium dendriticum]|nr:unnamed protein product [Dicrocoelium dendriticum]